MEEILAFHKDSSFPQKKYLVFFNVECLSYVQNLFKFTESHIINKSTYKQPLKLNDPIPPDCWSGSFLWKLAEVLPTCTSVSAKDCVTVHIPSIPAL